MDDNALNKIRDWFTGYADGFIKGADNTEDMQNFELKRTHTLNVAENARLIAASEFLDNKDNIISLAEITGLLHDAGRFEQYARHRTFNDRISVNHGKLGYRVVVEHTVLGEELTGAEAHAVLDAIRYHNALSLPDLEDTLTIDLLRIVRDADKLDVWRVLADYYETPANKRSPIVSNNLEDRPTYSKSALNSLSRGQVVNLSETAVLNDLRIMNLSWVYDLNYKASIRLMGDRKHIQRIASGLPETDEVKAALACLYAYIERKL